MRNEALADVIPMRSHMPANNYFKLATYKRSNAPEAAPRVKSQVFPFDSRSGTSRVRALRELHATMKPTIGEEMRVSVWRKEPGYQFPVIGEMEIAQEGAAEE